MLTAIVSYGCSCIALIIFALEQLHRTQTHDGFFVRSTYINITAKVHDIGNIEIVNLGTVHTTTGSFSGSLYASDTTNHAINNPDPISNPLATGLPEASGLDMGSTPSATTAQPPPRQASPLDLPGADPPIVLYGPELSEDQE
ncbi:MAG: hypothetical protein ACKPKO_32230, partial [Candidatus Fonsibacter sp.]